MSLEAFPAQERLGSPDASPAPQPSVCTLHLSLNPLFLYPIYSPQATPPPTPGSCDSQGWGERYQGHLQTPGDPEGRGQPQTQNGNL